MTGDGWTFEELLTNGWFPHWEPEGPPYRLTFTFYRSEITVDSVTATGDTEAEAAREAARRANAWLREHPHFKPRR
jgi:uncharacterized protein (DUF1697 family)